MDIAHTRAMVRAALDGALDGVETRVDPTFGVEVPLTCPDVPASFLDPRTTWADKDAYDRQAATLAAMFAANFEAYADGVTDEIREAGPVVTDASIATSVETTRARAEAGGREGFGPHEAVAVEVGDGREPEREERERPEHDRGRQHEDRRTGRRGRPSGRPTGPGHRPCVAARRPAR